MTGKLLLLPNLLYKEGDHAHFFAASVDAAVSTLQGLIAESEKEARSYLKRFQFSEGRTFRDIPIALFNEHVQEVDALLEPLQRGECWGLISDAGLPILADPGSPLVRRAAQLGIHVQAFAGPSSMILALLLSGLPAQRFAFHGYLPHAPTEALKRMETRSRTEQATQVFMETPYRNEKLFETLLQVLDERTVLSIACDLTAPSQYVETHSIKTWKKKSRPLLHKRPAVFVMNAAGSSSTGVPDQPV